MRSSSPTARTSRNSAGGASSTAAPDSVGRNGRRGSLTPTPPAGRSRHGSSGRSLEKSCAYELDRACDSAPLWSTASLFFESSRDVPRVASVELRDADAEPGR